MIGRLICCCVTIGHSTVARPSVRSVGRSVNRVEYVPQPPDSLSFLSLYFVITTKATDSDRLCSTSGRRAFAATSGLRYVDAVSATESICAVVYALTGSSVSTCSLLLTNSSVVLNVNVTVSAKQFLTYNTIRLPAIGKYLLQNVRLGGH
jgi:hypothetical protein